MNREQILNDIGCGIIAFYNKEAKEFNEYTDKLFDKDLYSLYEIKKQYRRYFGIVLDACKDEDFKQNLIKFRTCFLDRLDDKIYSREIVEKNENDYYDN